MSGTNQRALEIQNAKAQLLQSKDGQPSTYTILHKAIRKLLDEGPTDSADTLSQIINTVTLETCHAESNIAEQQLIKEPSYDYKIAEQQLSLFESTANIDHENAEEDEENSFTCLPDIGELAYFFEQGSVGLGRDEWVRVYFALKKLCGSYNLSACRFWGKILGIEKNYYIAEILYRDDEDLEDDDMLRNQRVEEEDDDEEDELEKLPQSQYKQPPQIPTEMPGMPGVNKFTYFVCNEPGDEWLKLPNCTPEQIQTSRKVTKYLTGNLNAPIVSFPQFPGKERHLLRTQIARISAATIIAPMTYYQFDEEEEVDDEEMAQTDFIENPDYEGVPIRDLADPSLQAWVHSRLHILQQGRCIWWNPKEKTDNDEEFDEDDDDAAEENENEPEQEIGPPLLTQVSDDIEISGIPAWSTHLSSGLAHIQHTICMVKSNLWPGATSFSNGRRFDNIYIGWGCKYQNENYSPSQPMPFQSESLLPELTETNDPSVEEETALKQQHELDDEEREDEEEIEEDD